MGLGCGPRVAEDMEPHEDLSKTARPSPPRSRPRPGTPLYVERSDGGVDLMQDSTDEGDARSSETSAVAEKLVDAVPEHDHDVPLADAVTTAEGLAASLELLGTNLEPCSAARLSWSPTELFEGVPVSTPVLAVNGALPGPTLCLTAAVHGDELNGIEMVRRVLHDIDPDKLSGAVIGVPIVNVQGFRRGSRYLPDRRDRPAPRARPAPQVRLAPPARRAPASNSSPRPSTTRVPAATGRWSR